MPADYSFASVNDYVHGVDRYFEEPLTLEVTRRHAARTEAKNGGLLAVELKA